jgi:hypothetical protein
VIAKGLKDTLIKLKKLRVNMINTESLKVVLLIIRIMKQFEKQAMNMLLKLLRKKLEKWRPLFKERM